MTPLYPFILVPAQWMAACGKPAVDTVFPVRSIQFYGEGRTIANVDLPNGRSWTVWVEGRGATLLNSNPAEAMTLSDRIRTALPHMSANDREVLKNMRDRAKAYGGTLTEKQLAFV